jgi:U3 small nucleolar RNA-associated protein 11
MQRALMGKGGRRKLRGVEKVEGGGEADEDEDAMDDRRSRKNKGEIVSEKTWKPRVYKWKLERKR